MSVQKPQIVLRYRQRADSFYKAVEDLLNFGTSSYAVYAPATGLLAVHACIALADALLVSVGEKGDKQAKEQDHSEAARRLKKWCSATKIQDSGGIKHFSWLLSKKTEFSYDDKYVDDAQFQKAVENMYKFFAWASHNFPSVAQLNNTDADHA